MSEHSGHETGPSPACRGRPVIVIGLDGATWNIIHPAINAGYMPYIASRLAEGAHGKLRTTIPCNTCPAVPSIFTGKNAGELGIFDFVKPDGTPVASTDVAFPFLWEIAGEQGATTLVVNVRFTYPPHPLNGVLICGGLTSVEGRVFTYPPELSKEISFWVSGEIEARTRHLVQDLDANRLQIYEDRKTQYEQRWSVFKRLLHGRDYDLAIMWVGTLDSIQHYCWNYPELIYQYLRMIDRDLQLLAEDFPERNFVVFSDHGFAAAPTKAFNVNSWLRDLGYCQSRSSLKGKLYAWGKTTVAPWLPIWAKNALRSLVRKRAAKRSTQAGAHVPEGFVFASYRDLVSSIDYRRSKAFLACKWGISLNEANSAEDIRRTGDELIHELAKLRDSNGLQVVQEAHWREEVYSGRYVPLLPHILFLSAPEYTARPLLRPEVLGPDPEAPTTISGSHSVCREGVFMAWGPDIASNVETYLDCTDITPTLLHLMGCSVPDNLDGKVHMEVMRLGSLPQEQSVSYITPIEVHRGEGLSAFTEGESELVRRRLEDLGYL